MARMRSTGPTHSQNKNEGSEAIRVSVFCYVVLGALYQLDPYQHSAELALLLIYLEVAVTAKIDLISPLINGYFSRHKLPQNTRLLV